MAITYEKANNTTDLHEILRLQSENLGKNLSAEERTTQGFVTLQHDFDTLAMMNAPYPHIIAKTENAVIGYALTMLPTMSEKVPLLRPMFELIDNTVYLGQPLAESNYLVMGQICVAKNYRGIGVFRGLYQAMQAAYASEFSYLITDISLQNPRSQKAHENIGFKVIRTYQDSVGTWNMVIWKW